LWAPIEFRLMPTDGLRLLDAGITERILDSCRKVLKLSGFIFKDNWTTVTSGMPFLFHS
jgi:apyrase